MTAEEQKVKHNEGAWVITWVDGKRADPARVGRAGPSDITMTNDEILNSPDSHEFRMFEDGEEEPDFKGKCYLPFGLTEEAFYPLDNMGVDTGCAWIEYLDKVTGEWEML
jgi:hypothetical protein